MENLTIILFLCVVLPMLPALFLLPDRRSKLFLGFLLGGTAVCLISAALNSALLPVFHGERTYLTTNITPITEEICKSLPLLYYAWVVSDDRNELLSLSFAMGLGFALLENLVILTGSISSVSLSWAFMRGLGAALMHSTCTASVGVGLGYIRKRRKLFLCGTFSLLMAAIIYHGTFNSLVQSRYRVAAFFLTVLMCLPLIRVQMGRVKR